MKTKRRFTIGKPEPDTWWCRTNETIEPGSTIVLIRNSQPGKPEYEFKIIGPGRELNLSGIEVLSQR